ncbi:hypothetical protein K1T71_008397, partial [Dendrolimus kikuchii]
DCVRRFRRVLVINVVPEAISCLIQTICFVGRSLLRENRHCEKYYKITTKREGTQIVV